MVKRGPSSQEWGQQRTGWPLPSFSVRLYDRLSLIVAAIVIPVEIEHIEEVADRRHVDWNIGIVIVGARIG